MSLGSFAGGMADGIGEGIKIRAQADKNKREREAEAGKERQKALMAGIPELGAEKPATWTAQGHIDEAVAGIPVKPSPVERVKQAIARKLRPQDAAAAAGIQTKPIVVAPPEGAASTGGIPAQAEGEAAPIVVEPPKAKRVSDTDQLRIMIRAAVEGGDQEGAAKMYEQLGKLQQRDLALDVQQASTRGMPGLANTFEKLTGQVVEYEPVEGGKFKITVDGDEWGVKSTDEVRDELMGLATKNPEYAREASLLRDKGMREERVIASDERYKNAMAAVNQYRANLEAKRTNADVAQSGAQTEKIKVDTQQAQQELQEYEELMGPTGLGGDGNLNAENIMRRATAMAANGKGSYSKVVTNRDGTQQVVSGNSFVDLAEARVAADKARFKNSPYANTTLGTGTTPILTMKTIGNGRYYAVYGINNGVFDSLDAAEQAARRMYPPVPKKK